MQMNFFAFFPGLYKDPNTGGNKSALPLAGRIGGRRPGDLVPCQ